MDRLSGRSLESDAVVVGRYFASIYLSGSRSPLTRRRSFGSRIETRAAPFVTCLYTGSALLVLRNLWVGTTGEVLAIIPNEAALSFRAASEAAVGPADVALVAAHIAGARDPANAARIGRARTRRRSED